MNQITFKYFVVRHVVVDSTVSFDTTLHEPYLDEQHSILLFIQQHSISIEQLDYGRQAICLKIFYEYFYRVDFGVPN